MVDENIVGYLYGVDMTKEEIIEMAIKCGWDEHHAKYDTRFEPFAKLAFEKGRQQGMKQERALWELSASSQEIEKGDNNNV